MFHLIFANAVNFNLGIARFLLVICLLVVSTAQAQVSRTITDGYTPTGVEPGAPAGSYPLSNFDNINMFNGTLNFRLPLLTVGGRGTAGHTITLPIEQHWQVYRYYPDSGGTGEY